MKTTKFLWFDMEMSGLDPEKEVPIEVAAVVTDVEFNELGEYHAVVKQPQKYIDGMDDWNKRQHGLTGLISMIPNGLAPERVDEDLAAFVKTHFGKERAILSGNSISQDRLFVRRYLPKLESMLHYRMLDVTAWKVIFNERYDLKFKKKEGHRALDDVRESLAELKFYLSQISIGNGPA